MKRVPRKRAVGAFTLVELLVSIVVLTILVLLLNQLFSGATTVATASTMHSEADDTARQLFTRMAADFSHMVKRTDVDYYIKSTSSGTTSLGTTMPSYPMTGGNDQLAFYSEVAGYSTTTDAQNTVSLVAYRVNSQGVPATPMPYMERLGKALSWTASNPGAIQPVAFAPQTILINWPAATDPTATDADYEMIAPNVFRFEYYYVLRSGATSTVPWDVKAGSTGLSGFKDVAAIGVAIALADRKTATLTSLTSLTGLAGKMRDFADDDKIGALESAWQNVIATSTLSVPIKNGIRIYGRLFCITPPSQ